MNVSDQLVKKWKLPKGSLLRIFPVSGNVEDQDDEDHSYTIAWEADKQYWYDIIYDPSRDRDSRSKEVVLVDASDRSDTFVVPVNANVHQVRDLWQRFLEVPYDIQMYMQTSNDHEFYWSLDTVRDLAAYTFKASNFHGSARVYEGSPNFVTEQLSRNLSLKLPPLTLCQQIPSRHHMDINYGGEVWTGTPQLSQRLLKIHLLSWNLAGTILRSPQASTWWLPYNKEAIMRYGHSVNSSIPDNPDEAEFPDEPWPQEVTIRIKSHPDPQPSAVPVSTDGSSSPAAGP
jgi:hypothetical protein